jgi:hypothetical protein
MTVQIIQCCGSEPDPAGWQYLARTGPDLLDIKSGKFSQNQKQNTLERVKLVVDYMHISLEMLSKTCLKFLLLFYYAYTQGFMLNHFQIKSKKKMSNRKNQCKLSKCVTIFSICITSFPITSG